MGAPAQPVGIGADPTPEELLTLLEVYEKASGQAQASVPDDLKVGSRSPASWACHAPAHGHVRLCIRPQELLDNVHRKQGRPTEEWDVQEIVPQPG